MRIIENSLIRNPTGLINIETPMQLFKRSKTSIEQMICKVLPWMPDSLKINSRKGKILFIAFVQSSWNSFTFQSN